MNLSALHRRLLADAALDGYRQVADADADGRLAPRARRGLADLARIAGDFPTALAAVPTLGWEGRHHRVLGHIRWPHGDISHAVTAFEAARTEAEQHDAPGERAIAQTLLALVCAFADPLRADEELALARQFLAQLDQRATTLYADVAALVRDAGTDRDVTDRATVLRTEITVAGLAWLTPLLETVLAFHHAVREDDLTSTIDRLREATATGGYAYYVDIATAMGDLPEPAESATQWLDDAHTVRQRWRALVTARQDHLRGIQYRQRRYGDRAAPNRLTCTHTAVAPNTRRVRGHSRSSVRVRPTLGPGRPAGSGDAVGVDALRAGEGKQDGLDRVQALGDRPVPRRADGVGEGVEVAKRRALLLTDRRQLLAVLRKCPPGAERLRLQVPQPLVVRRRLICHTHHPDRPPARQVTPPSAGSGVGAVGAGDLVRLMAEPAAAVRHGVLCRRSVYSVSFRARRAVRTDASSAAIKSTGGSGSGGSTAFPPAARVSTSTLRASA
nr:hypothetical protein [Streptomyces halobius]